MAALSEDVKLLIVVLILLFAPGLVEATFKKVEQHEREELAISSESYDRSRTANDSTRDRALDERINRPQRFITFHFIRE